MANSKKTQQEIERQLRGAQDSIDKFDELHNKFVKAGTQLQGRIMEELKKEARKLQRVLDAMRSTITGLEAKDKKAFESCQKTIEEKMETLKVCERETRAKLRALSKERGGASASHEALQTHTESWMKSAIENARKQVEVIERNLRGHHVRGENFSTSEAKKLNRLKRHIAKIENLLELVITGNVNLNEVARLEEPVLRMLRNDANGDDNDKNDEDIYSGLNIDDIHHERQQGDTDADDSNFGQNTPIRAFTVSPTATKLQSQAAAKNTSPSMGIGRAECLKQQGSSTANSSFKPGNSESSAGVGRLLPRRDSQQETWDEAADLLDDDMDNANADTFGDEAMEMAGPGSLAELANATCTMSRMGDWEKGCPASLTPTALGRASPSTASSSARAHGLESAVAVTPSTNATTTPTTTTPTTAQSALVTAAKLSPPLQQQQRATEQRHQSSGAMATGPSVSYDKAMMLRLVNMSLANLPHTRDVDRQRPFEPSNPTTCPSYYPSQVIPVFASPDIYREFDLETLFFIFYYHQNTYQQYFAARQIKTQSFRYHTQLNTWFQRNGRMTEAEGGERGSFIYFNYEDSWQIEEKEDFTFNYQYLEDELR